MARLRSIAFAQRVVVVVGFGLLLAVIGVYVATDGFRGAGDGGWFAYAPGTDTYVAVRHVSGVRTLVVPLGLIALWTLCSMWLLGERKPKT